MNPPEDKPDTLDWPGFALYAPSAFTANAGMAVDEKIAATAKDTCVRLILFTLTRMICLPHYLWKLLLHSLRSCFFGMQDQFTDPMYRPYELFVSTFIQSKKRETPDVQTMAPARPEIHIFKNCYKGSIVRRIQY